MTIVHDQNDIGAAEFCSHGNYSEKQHSCKHKGTEKNDHQGKRRDLDTVTR